MVIAVTSRITYEKNYHEIRDAISHDLSFFFANQKFFFTIIPNVNIKPEIFFKNIPFDILILSGGDDVNLNNKNKNSRENTETNYLSFCIKNKIPVIGICRGMQFVNSYFGGKTSVDKDTTHLDKYHIVSSIKKYDFLPSQTFIVNSYHNNIININDLSSSLVPTCFAKDKTIESFVHKKYPILGIMWHPERNFNNDEINIFFKKEFLKKAKKFLINNL